MEQELRTYIFIHKNSSAVITVSDVYFDNAAIQMMELGCDIDAWRCENEDGEEE